MYKFDENLGTYRLTSAAFHDKDTNNVEVSTTHLERLLAAGLQPEDAIGRNRLDQGFGMASLQCGYLRKELNQKLVPEETKEDPYHTLIVGKKSKRILKKMAMHATEVIKPNVSG